MRRILQDLNRSPYAESSSAIRIRKRKRENCTAIKIFPLLKLDAKKRRVLPDEVLYLSNDDLCSLDSRQNELCCGSIGRDVVYQKQNKIESESTAGNNDELAVYSPPASNMTSTSYILRNPVIPMQIPAQHTPSFQNPLHHEECFKTGLQFLDASSLTASKQE